MKMLQIYIICCYSSILVVTMILQMNKKQKMDRKYDPSNLLLKIYKYDEWYKKDEEKSISQPEEIIAEWVKLRRQIADNEYLSDLGFQYISTTKSWKQFIQKKKKKKNEIRQILLCLLYQYNKITEKVYNNLIKSL